uniref:39S ribosomal protein L55, mitochondrial n=1 Tax=Syphacia muris TaxID=451379 RepID=A0A0N5AUA8_9BILA
LFAVRQNAYRCAISKIHRTKYIRRYEVKLLNSDGSTIAIRAPEPRYCIQLPLDLKALSESERRKRLAARKKKTIKIKEEVIDDNFDSNEYVNFWKDESSKTVEVTGERKTENL